MERRTVNAEVIAQAAEQIAAIIDALPYSEEWNRFSAYDFDEEIRNMINETDIIITADPVDDCPF